MEGNRFSNRGFTALELALVVVSFAILTLVILPALGLRHRAPNARIRCVNNQKMIGTALRIFAGDNNDKFPAELLQSSTNDGWLAYAALTNAGPQCWKFYAMLSNDLGLSTKIITCPSDVRSPAKDFGVLRNKNISYFFNPGANDSFPQSILAGDRNLAPGTTSKNDFGFSPSDGSGNDVILQTNSPICWSLKMHSAGNTSGEGNILLGDGSVQQTSSARLRIDYQANAVDAGNFPFGYNNSKSNSFRLIFP